MKKKEPSKGPVCDKTMKRLRDTLQEIIKEEQSRKRLKQIAEIIERVDNRCMARDGPVGKTIEEMTDKEIIQIYELAKGT